MTPGRHARVIWFKFGAQLTQRSVSRVTHATQVNKIVARTAGRALFLSLSFDNYVVIVNALLAVIVIHVLCIGWMDGGTKSKEDEERTM